MKAEGTKCEVKAKHGAESTHLSGLLLGGKRSVLLLHNLLLFLGDVLFLKRGQESVPVLVLECLILGKCPKAVIMLA